jgi:hypothetical protein
MTVLVDHSGSVLGRFLPERRVKTIAAPTARRERAPLRARLAGRGRAVKDFVVAVTAFGCCDYAAFQWHSWAGFLAIGISVLLVDHSVDRKPAPPGGDGP